MTACGGVVVLVRVQLTLLSRLERLEVDQVGNDVTYHGAALVAALKDTVSSQVKGRHAVGKGGVLEA